jgi:hypothetical protein
MQCTVCKQKFRLGGVVTAAPIPVPGSGPVASPAPLSEQPSVSGWSPVDEDDGSRRGRRQVDEGPEEAEDDFGPPPWMSWGYVFGILSVSLFWIFLAGLVFGALAQSTARNELASWPQSSRYRVVRIQARRGEGLGRTGVTLSLVVFIINCVCCMPLGLLLNMGRG